MAESGFVGEIRMFVGDTPPASWELCHGQILQIEDYSAFYEIIGNRYGGDGVTTFALPDFRSRLPVGQGQGSGLSNYALGQQGGAEARTLGANQMPAHNHPVNAFNGDAEYGLPGGHFLAVAADGNSTYGPAANTTMNSNMIATAGGNQPVEILPPYLCVNFIICMQGMFPTPA